MPEIEDILPVIHALIDIVAGLKAIDASRQAELHAALEGPQDEPETAPEPEPAAEPDPTQ
jgi:hypothetical protein